MQSSHNLITLQPIAVFAILQLLCSTHCSSVITLHHRWKSQIANFAMHHIISGFTSPASCDTRISSTVTSFHMF